MAAHDRLAVVVVMTVVVAVVDSMTEVEVVAAVVVTGSSEVVLAGVSVEVDSIVVDTFGVMLVVIVDAVLSSMVESVVEVAKSGVEVVEVVVVEAVVVCKICSEVLVRLVTILVVLLLVVLLLVVLLLVVLFVGASRTHLQPWKICFGSRLAMGEPERGLTGNQKCPCC